MLKKNVCYKHILLLKPNTYTQQLLFTYYIQNTRKTILYNMLF